MKKDEMRPRPEQRLAKLGRQVGRDAPRREEFGVQEYAASQTRNPQNIR